MEPICAVLDLAPSVYYAAKKRETDPCARARRDECLRAEILRIFYDPQLGRGIYGVEKIWHQLQREGVEVARCTTERLMRELGLEGLRGKRKRPRTTTPGDESRRPSDLLERDFSAPAPNRRWVADITYVGALSGWVYTALITDLFARVIVGWKTSTSLATELVLDALEMSIWARKDRFDGQLIHHGDRGSQYLSIAYSQRLTDIDAIQSVGSRGDSYDNAAAESVNSLYKKECIDFDGPWNNVNDVTFATMEYVSWYNKDRLHSYCGHVPPKEFEDDYYQTLAAQRGPR